MQTRLFQAGFCFMGSGSRASRKRDARAGHSAHPASLHQYPAQSNRAGYPLVRKAILHLDDIAGSMAFSESEQSKNGAGEMVPLYAARVQDTPRLFARGHALKFPRKLLRPIMVR